MSRAQGLVATRLKGIHSESTHTCTLWGTNKYTHTHTHSHTRLGPDSPAGCCSKCGLQEKGGGLSWKVGCSGHPAPPGAQSVLTAPPTSQGAAEPLPEGRDDGTGMRQLSPLGMLPQPGPVRLGRAGYSRGSHVPTSVHGPPPENAGSAEREAGAGPRERPHSLHLPRDFQETPRPSVHPAKQPTTLPNGLEVP